MSFFNDFGVTIIAKNDVAAEYPFISITGNPDYRRQKKQIVLLKNLGSTVFSETDTSNAIVKFVIWLHHGLIKADPKRPKDFRLVGITEDQLFLLRD